MRNFHDQTGYGSTPEDQRFALCAAIFAVIWLVGGLTVCKLTGWL